MVLRAYHQFIIIISSSNKLTKQQRYKRIKEGKYLKRLLISYCQQQQTEQHNIAVNNIIKKIKRMEVNERHLVSIDVLIDDQSRSYKDLSTRKKKHRLTIFVGCQNQLPTRVSINKNNVCAPQSSTKIAGDFGIHKYYFNKKNKKDRARLDGGLTQRKIGNGITASLCRGPQNSKSYRVHTIDYLQEGKKQILGSKKKIEANINRSTIQDLTNKKRKILQKCKQKMNKKSMISQSDLTQFTSLGKERKGRDKQGVTVNLRHRKYNKAKTEFEQLENGQAQCQVQGTKQRCNVVSEAKECLVKKIQFKKNRIRSINSQSQRETIQMKEISQPTQASHKQIIKAQSGDEKQDNFGKYLYFIGKSKGHTHSNINKCNNSRNTIQSRSFVAKNTSSKLGLRDGHNSSVTKQQNPKAERQRQLTPKPKDNNQQDLSANDKVIELNCKQLRSSYLELDFSQIPEINQSSFLSSKGKGEIVMTPAFQLLETKKAVAVQQQEQTIPKENEFGKKKRRKKESKMSVYCRSQMKQAFPQNFFC